MARVACLFPGQGAQSVGMGKAVLETSPAARALFDHAREILGYDLAEICLQGPKEKLNSTAVSQPAIFSGSLAALEVLKSSDTDAISNCVATAGLSLGEYTALVFAGALSFRDGLLLVQKRGQAMQAAADATPGGMVSIIGWERAQVQAVVDEAKPEGYLAIANLLCPRNIVISGAKAACAKAQKLAEEQGAATVALAVAGAFHTPLMKPADEQLAKALEQVEIRPPRIPVYSNVDAAPHTEPAEIRQLLVRQVLSPVLWEDTLRRLLEFGVERFHEIGPGRVLAGLLKRVDRKKECRNTTF
ncbi:MAG TPA: ACP S-malonyltransferase [Gemmataceae bacterium]|jgi:[acyl-carrier-protein] S-malonyltransferase|nr:ACP S-malonyltransferase [Gemmataceae bacterium]